MAKLPVNSLLNGITGHIGKKMVFKKHGDETIVTAYPATKRRKKKSDLQMLKQGWFKDAVKHAQHVIRDPEQKQHYLAKVKKHQSVFNYVIQEYLLECKRKQG